MNRLPPLIPHLALPLSAALVLAATVFAVWCIGYCYGKLRPRPSLISSITESRFTALVVQGREAGAGKPNIDPKIARTLYRYLREVQGVAVAPLPDDHLVWDLGLTEEQIEQAMIDLARRLNRYVAQPPVRLPSTPEDLARLLGDLPLASTSPSARAA